MCRLIHSERVTHDVLEWLEITLEGINDDSFTIGTHKEAWVKELSEIINGMKKLCADSGHFVVDDTCGKPEHRWCSICEESTPNVELASSRSSVDESINVSEHSNQNEKKGEQENSKSMIERVKTWFQNLTQS